MREISWTAERNEGASVPHLGLGHRCYSKIEVIGVALASFATTHNDAIASRFLSIRIKVFATGDGLRVGR